MYKRTTVFYAILTSLGCLLILLFLSLQQQVEIEQSYYLQYEQEADAKLKSVLAFQESKYDKKMRILYFLLKSKVKHISDTLLSKDKQKILESLEDFSVFSQKYAYTPSLTTVNNPPRCWKSYKKSCAQMVGFSIDDIGLLLENHSFFQQAQQFYRIRMAQFCPTYADKIQAHIKYASFCIRQKNFPQAKKALFEASNFTHAHKNMSSYGYPILFLLAEIAVKERQYDSAIKYLMQRVAQYKSYTKQIGSAASQRGLAITYYKIGNVYLISGDIENSLKYFRKVIQIKRKQYVVPLLDYAVYADLEPLRCSNDLAQELTSSSHDSSKKNTSIPLSKDKEEKIMEFLHSTNAAQVDSFWDGFQFEWAPSHRPEQHPISFERLPENVDNSMLWYKRKNGALLSAG